LQLTPTVPEGIDSAPSEDDQQLFKLLFKQHASGIYRLAYSQLHSHVGAQEIVQECFMKFWEKRHAVGADPSARRGYLYTSAQHAVLNQLRRAHQWAYQDYPEDLALEAAAQTTELEYEELQDIYSKALAHLPSKRQLIFRMSRQQGMSNAKIAQELNISIKTVEAQLTHALKFMRHYFTIRGVVLGVLISLPLLEWAFTGATRVALSSSPGSCLIGPVSS
jgi:RNA polymerase sigma-70 factor (ECF subfamily)